jgi:hypothetical protein
MGIVLTRVARSRVGTMPLAVCHGRGLASEKWFSLRCGFEPCGFSLTL